MTEAVYLGIDLGTQSVRVLAVSETGVVLATGSAPLASTRDGALHEQEPEQWWHAVAQCCRQVMAALDPGVRIEGLSVDATSGTVLLMDDTLRALTPGLMYDDSRARDETAAVNSAGAQLWAELSYRMQPSWALPKLVRLARRKEIPAVAQVAHQNDFVNARLAGRRVASDSSNSLKTGYDLLRSRWPGDTLAELGLDPGMFPQVVSPGQRIGSVCAAAAGETGLPAGTPIFAGMTDGCGAQLASGATAAGSWHSVVGTTLVVKGATPELLRDPLGVVYSHRSADGLWLPGGASSTGAGAIARDFAPGSLESLNAQTLAAEPTRLVTYPLIADGERYPFAAPAARGFTLGAASSEQERYHAVLQGIAFIERLAFDGLRMLNAPTDGRISISGGAARSEALNQIRADVLGRELVLPRVLEGAFGMAVLVAAHSCSIAEATGRMVHVERTIAPQRPFSAYAEQYRAMIEQLAERGWLPQPLAQASLAGASA